MDASNTSNPTLKISLLCRHKSQYAKNFRSNPSQTRISPAANNGYTAIPHADGRLAPAEDAESNGKHDDGVGEQDGHLRPQRDERLAFQHHAAKGLVQGGERQGVNQRLNFRGEA